MGTATKPRLDAAKINQKKDEMKRFTFHRKRDNELLMT